eukprot:PhM_4_TR18104/c0_g2_i1/m.97523
MLVLHQSAARRDDCRHDLAQPVVRHRVPKLFVVLQFMDSDLRGCQNGVRVNDAHAGEERRRRERRRRALKNNGGDVGQLDDLTRATFQATPLGHERTKKNAHVLRQVTVKAQHHRLIKRQRLFDLGGNAIQHTGVPLALGAPCHVPVPVHVLDAERMKTAHNRLSGAVRQFMCLAPCQGLPRHHRTRHRNRLGDHQTLEQHERGADVRLREVFLELLEVDGVHRGVPRHALIQVGAEGGFDDVTPQLLCDDAVLENTVESGEYEAILNSDSALCLWHVQHLVAEHHDLECEDDGLKHVQRYDAWLEVGDDLQHSPELQPDLLTVEEAEAEEHALEDACTVGLAQGNGAERSRD